MTRVLRVIGSTVGAAAAVYGAYVALIYLRFGRISDHTAGNPLLDRFLPEHEVRERHSVRVAASAEITFAAAGDVSFRDSRVARMIFALREVPMRLLGSRAAITERRSILDEVTALGWRELDKAPGRHIMGAVTQPWKREVHFRGLSPDEFVSFREPGYAKIAWTIEVDPAGHSASVFSTETRVMTTDPESHERFRRYWAVVSPGILIIRHEILRQVRTEAERRAGLHASAAADVRRLAPP
jgi:hypothetical protein